MTTAREVLRNSDGLPTLSQTVGRLAMLLGDEKSSLQDFERIIKPDPALTANLLRLANSAYFGLRRQVTSVRQAVSLLGIDRVFEIAAGASFTKVLPERIPGYEIDAASYFTHCLAVGAMAEDLSVRLAMKDVDMVFTAGLLHDIGKLAIGSFLIRDRSAVKEALSKQGARFIDVEREIIGTTHEEVGGLMVEEWHLPESFLYAVTQHHNSEEAPNGADQKIADLIHVADGLAHMMGFGADVGELKRTIDDRAVHRLHVKVHDLEIAAMDTMDSIKEMSEIIGGMP